MHSTEQSIEEVDDKTLSAFRNLAALVIARLIGTKQINPSKVRSKKKFRELINQLGRTDDWAFEIHIDHVAQKINSIHICTENGDSQSAVVLLHTLIEREVNTVVRLFLRIRGFSHTAITESIGGVDLKSKLDVLLPLIGVQPSARIRQLAFESQRIRNALVHFKANPIIATDLGERKGDHDVTQEKATEFFRRNTISAIRKELEPFVDICASQCPELQAAHTLIERFKS
ncbi:MAG: hypothetical protein LWW83_04115 [Azonexaceae bacterium]|uniref:hypothetical protein n=1 Tax=Azonexus sp. R2A61 TaxID=2744443 RepID=UPI001F433618|nr:hypothetical protein [Azonexus sp. R2A61]MCE1239097.1 hypothetical protein [Azonexaceae bacterium]